MGYKEVVDSVMKDSFPKIGYSLHSDMWNGKHRVLMECFEGEDSVFEEINEAISSRLRNVELYIIRHPDSY